MRKLTNNTRLTLCLSIVFFQPVFVITTGKQTADQGVYLPLDIVSSRLQSKGAAVFVLGIGEDADTSELNEIASSPNNVFRVDSFENLDDRLPRIRKGICKLGKSFWEMGLLLAVFCISTYM